MYLGNTNAAEYRSPLLHSPASTPSPILIYIWIIYNIHTYESRILALQTTSFLKLRWFVGTAFLAAPVVFCHYRAAHFVAAPLPKDATVHIAIAWAVGALMSFLADTYRR